MYENTEQHSDDNSSGSNLQKDKKQARFDFLSSIHRASLEEKTKSLAKPHQAEKHYYNTYVVCSEAYSAHSDKQIN